MTPTTIRPDTPTTHRHDRLYATRPWVLVPGNARNPLTWWRVPTTLTQWSPDMRYGLAVVNGRVVDWDAAKGPV